MLTLWIWSLFLIYGKSLNLPNLLSRASYRASKWVYSRSRLQACYITRYSSKSISASSTLALFSSGESEEENIGSDSKTSESTASKVTTGRLSSKKVSFLKLFANFSTLISKGKVSTINLDDQVSAKKSRNCAQKHPKTQASILGLFNLIYGSAESFF